jgi:FMN phosphatase YigB (HAD superfamily)
MDLSDIKVIGFDLDQTLYPKSPEIDEAIRKPIYKEISKFLKVDSDRAKDLFNCIHQDGRGLSGRKTLIKLGADPETADKVVQDAVENSDIAKFLTPRKEVSDFLEDLKKKYSHIDLITGSHTENALAKLGRLGVKRELFDHIIAGEVASKTDKTAYSLWFSYYPQLKADNFLYIGDRISSDYEIPREIGIHSILVNIEKADSSLNCIQLSSFIELSNHL